MKYRKLTVDELEPLKSEFISFLSANGIDVALWSKYKITSLDIVDNLVKQFSELVFEKICSKIDYLSFESNNLKAAYHVKNDHTTMVIREQKNDLTPTPEGDGIEKSYLQETPDLYIYKLDRYHEEDKYKEVYNLLETGCIKSNGAKYKEMILQWAATKAASN